MQRNLQTQPIYKKTQKQSEAATEAEEKKKQIDDLGFEVSHMIMLQQKNWLLKYVQQSFVIEYLDKTIINYNFE